MTTLYTPQHATMQPRPYQAEALAALHQHLCEKSSNPCVVLPTAAGKSPTMAWMIQRYKQEYPSFRCIVLAHVKELVQQNAEKLLAIWPGAPVGVYAAGLNSRQMTKCITFASIDSVYQRAYDFDPFDLVIVDEAHRIPARGEGKYRRFIGEATKCNPKLRTVGFTATPYRLGLGDICHHDHILNEVCYEANVRDLIDQGYLCPLRSKSSANSADLRAVGKRGGEYIASQLADAVDPVVPEAIRECVGILNAENRQGVIFFCVSVDHCHHVSRELRRYGIDTPVVTGKTPKPERDRIVRRFVDGDIRAICNINVFTEGFDATRIDAVVLLRPTQSMGLYTQMVGRGLRLDPRKSDCLVLDFAGCIDEHGPIDRLASDGVVVVTCGECREVFSKVLGECPQCGTELPKMEYVQREPLGDTERQLHGKKPSSRSILSSNEPETFNVDDVIAERHKKDGKPDSIRVSYRCGLTQFREWICLDHDGYAGRKAAQWWRSRFGDPVPNVDAALADMFLGHKLNQITSSVTVKSTGKYTEIISADITAMEGVRV